MKRLISAGLFTLVSFLPAFSGLAEDTTDPLANAPTQYSADLVVTRKMGPPRPMTIKVYFDGDKRRTEQGGGSIIILRGDLAKRYILMPNNKTYMEAPFDPKMLESSNDWAKKMGLIHEKVATEEVNGELCDKYRYSSDPKKSENTQNKPAITGFIWVAQTTHMMVKSENAGSTAEWKNIKIGPPDASLFELPADYKKAEVGKLPPLTLPSPKSEEQKSENQKPAELKSDQSPSPSPSASPAGEKSDEQKSGDKSDGDK